MNDDRKTPSTPPTSDNDARRLGAEMEPPPDLEDRVTSALLARGLLAREEERALRTTLSSLLRAAAVLLVFLTGLGIGRWMPGSGSVGDARPAEDLSRYALLLYETESYEPASGGQELELYEEYSRWVALARERQQFITGEDFAVDRGWVVAPPALGGDTEPGVAVGGAPVLSGVFLIAASDDREALALAAELPHLRRGGHVVVQRVLPTEAPPAIE